MRRTKFPEKKKSKDIKTPKKYTKEELERIMPQRWLKVAHKYVVKFNMTKCYNEVYNCKNDKVASVCGSRLLANAKFRQYLEYIKEDFATVCGITKMSQVQEYAKLAYSSVGHMHNSWVDLKTFDELSDVQKECIESVHTKTEVRKDPLDESELVEVKFVHIKLHSKIAALTRIDKLLGFEAAQVHEISTEAKVSIDGLTDEEKAILLRAARRAHGRS